MFRLNPKLLNLFAGMWLRFNILPIVPGCVLKVTDNEPH